MKNKHLKLELEFFKKAFSDNETRRDRGISWEYTPSKTMIEIINSNNLNENAENKRVLDLGCGDGRHTNYFREKGFYVVGVDFCKEAIELYKKRFKDDKKVSLEQIDLTEKGVLSHFGEFDIVLDWSVLDHIRRKYLPTYISNIVGSIKQSGHLIAAEFDSSISRFYKNKDYKSRRGHYSRGFDLQDLVELLNPLILVDYREKILEDEIKGYKFNTVLMKKTIGE